MTGPTVAPQSREPVVARKVVLALGASARGNDPAGAGHELAAHELAAHELAAHGLLGADGRPVESAAATAAAIGAPLVTVRITAAERAGSRAADLWVGESRAVLHPAGNAPAPLVTFGRSLLPQLIVRTVGLGPRPLADAAAFPASGASVAAACRGTATPPWPGAVERPVLWRIDWTAAAGSGGVAVLDLGAQGGLWRPSAGSGDELSWSPVRGAEVWAALGGLFAVALVDGPAEAS